MYWDGMDIIISHISRLPGVGSVGTPVLEGHDKVVLSHVPDAEVMRHILAVERGQG